MTTPLEKKIDEFVCLHIVSQHICKIKFNNRNPLPCTFCVAKTAILQLLTETLEAVVPEKQLALDQPGLYRGDGVSHEYLRGKNAAIDQTTTNIAKELKRGE